MKTLSQQLAGLFLCFVLAGCATQGRFAPLGVAYAPRPKDHPIEVFENNRPSRPFEKVARLDVHIEKTHFVGSSLASALPELKTQARLAGGDAIVDIQQRRSSLAETRIYHVTATAVRYRE